RDVRVGVAYGVMRKDFIHSPQHPGDPGKLDSPDDWYSEGYGIEKIASLRTSLVNSKQRLKVQETDRFVDNTREIAMARKPVDIEVSLQKKPGSQISGGRVKPVSASGDIEKFRLGENPSVQKKVERAFYDTDLKAENAVRELYGKGVDSYKLQQSLSAGMLGEEESRKLVPTRWSITATDDMLSKTLRERVKKYQQLGQIEYYRNEYVGNDFHIFLVPGRWEYELMELKRSGSVWNPASNYTSSDAQRSGSGETLRAAENTYIVQNYEQFSGRTEYAEETAGAYYAARLGALEHLDARNRQAKVLIFREVKPEYWAPLGVWVIRETVRNAFKDASEAEELDTFKQVQWKVGKQFRFLYSRIKQDSRMLNARQTELSDFSAPV
ncbi:MAG: hypothetical protein ABEI58_04385, partial [Candidatus Nanohaloarchaea archaeon]